MLNVFVTPEAKGDFAKLPEREQKKIRKRIAYLKRDIYAGKPLSGEYKGVYSLRAWPYRILYTVGHDEIWIAHISHRQSAYKK